MSMSDQLLIFPQYITYQYMLITIVKIQEITT